MALFIILSGLITMLLMFIGLCLRHWVISLFVIAMLWSRLTWHESHQNAQVLALRGYDPTVWTISEVQKAIRIDVPVTPSADVSTYPITLFNNDKRAYDGTFYVVCIAIQTVVGPDNWVLGIRQFPYLAFSHLEVPGNAIVTHDFRSVGTGIDAHTNVGGCEFYADGDAADAKVAVIDSKWIQVTKKGAALASSVDFKAMRLPMAGDTEDWKLPQ